VIVGLTDLVIIFAIIGMPVAVVAVVAVVIIGSRRRGEVQVQPLPPGPTAPPSQPPSTDAPPEPPGA